MANKSLPIEDGLRPALNPEAPWSDRAKKKLPFQERPRAVVYVVGASTLPMVKVGRTTELKRRVAKLSNESGKKVNILFFAELSRQDANAVEAMVKRLAGKLTDNKSGEWFALTAEVVARLVLFSIDRLGVRVFSTAGDPCARFDDIPDMDCHHLQPSKGRLAREFW